MAVLESTACLVVSTFLAFVPVRYRERWLPGERASDLGSAALISGVVECAAGFGLFLVRFSSIAPRSGIPPLPLDLGRAGGFLTLVNAVFEPLNVIFLLMFFEGMFRTLAALVGEAPPVLPLQLVAWAHDALEARARQGALPPLVADAVEDPVLWGESASGYLRISSCRRKPHWHPYVSIRYRGSFYGLLREQEVPGARPFVYLLRKRRDEEAVAVVYSYDPGEALCPDEAPVRWRPDLP